MKELMTSCLNAEILIGPGASPFSTAPTPVHNHIKTLIQWRLGELELLDANLHIEYFDKRHRDQSADVISKYLEEMHRHIEEERKNMGVGSRATAIMSYFEEGKAPPGLDAIPRLFLAQGNWMLAADETKRVAWE
jgi:hypothetical protein